MDIRNRQEADMGSNQMASCYITLPIDWIYICLSEVPAGVGLDRWYCGFQNDEGVPFNVISGQGYGMEEKLRLGVSQSI